MIDFQKDQTTVLPKEKAEKKKKKKKLCKKLCKKLLAYKNQLEEIKV